MPYAVSPRRVLIEQKLGHLRQIALPSGNLARSIQFYRDTLGLDFIAQYHHEYDR
jgi:hypothetical protein